MSKSTSAGRVRTTYDFIKAAQDVHREVRLACSARRRHTPLPVLESSTAAPSQHKLLQNQGLRAIQRSAPIKLLMRLALQAWLAALDDFRNWLIREAA